MQRPKQQAIMFLLGAVLVGGALGFTAERVLGREPGQENWTSRQGMYDDLELSSAQRATMDSLLDTRTCQIRAVLKPVRPQIDSIKRAGRQQIQRVLTSEQWTRFSARATEDSIRHAQNKRQLANCPE